MSVACCTARAHLLNVNNGFKARRLYSGSMPPGGEVAARVRAMQPQNSSDYRKPNTTTPDPNATVYRRATCSSIIAEKAAGMMRCHRLDDQSDDMRYRYWTQSCIDYLH